MNTCKIRNIVLGEGTPKVCVPIVGQTKEEIIDSAKKINEVGADIVEFRVDWFNDIFDFGKTEEVLKELREALGETPILFTFRTSKEGGEKAIEADKYVELNINAAKTGLVDAVDVEAFTGDEYVKAVVEAAHENGVKVVGSNLDFDKTPEKDDIVGRLRKMQELGVDVPKIAVMPQNKKDVITLLAATEEMFTNYADRPIITMSMAGTGAISRLSGEAFGSALTFGAVGKVSAPGQINVEDLKTVLNILLISMTLVLGVQIIARYVFQNSLTWSEELVRYLFIWSAFLGVPYCINKGASLKVVQFIDYLPAKLKNIVLMIDRVLMVVFFAAIFVFGLLVVKNSFLNGQRSPALGLPMYIVYLSVVVGSGLAIIRVIEKIVLCLKNKDERIKSDF